MTQPQNQELHWNTQLLEELSKATGKTETSLRCTIKQLAKATGNLNLLKQTLPPQPRNKKHVKREVAINA